MFTQIKKAEWWWHLEATPFVFSGCTAAHLVMNDGVLIKKKKNLADKIQVAAKLSQIDCRWRLRTMEDTAENFTLELLDWVLLDWVLLDRVLLDRVLPTGSPTLCISTRRVSHLLD